MLLPAISDHQAYGLLALDQPPALLDLLGLDYSAAANQPTLNQLLTKIVSAASGGVTGVVAEPYHGLPLLAGQKLGGWLFRLSSLTAADPLAVPTLLNDWSVEDCRQNYALAKLTLYYHPQEKLALAKKQLVAELYDYCQFQKIDFLLELLIYTPAKQEFELGSFQDDQLQAIQEFRHSASILAVQNPFSALAAATISAELDIPWLLSSQAQPYVEFKDQLRVALDNGAAGYLAGDSLWGELANFKSSGQQPDWSAIDHFLATSVRDRILELTRIVKESRSAATSNELPAG